MIPTNEKDSHRTLLGPIFSLIAVLKTDALIAGELKEVSRVYRDRYVTSIRGRL